MQSANQKHLTLEDRNYIEQALAQNMTFKEIAKFLSKDPGCRQRDSTHKKLTKEKLI